MIGMIAGAPSLQENQHHDHDQDHRLVDGLDQFVDGLRDELGRIVADIVIEPFGEVRLQLDHRVRKIFLAVARAFAPGRCVTSIATAVLRNRKLLVV